MVPLARVLCLGQQRADPRIGQRRSKHETLKHQREKATAICGQSLPTALEQRERIRGKEQRLNELIADNRTFLSAVLQTLDRLSPTLGAVVSLFEKPLSKEAHGA